LRFKTDRKLFFPYLLANYPSNSQFSELFEITSEYADAIEIGIPFSDPVADGPVIQKAAAQVLSRGFQLDSVFRFLQGRRTRKPIALMSYANPILAYGREQFLKACRQSAISYLIVPDVPMEEASDWKEETNQSGLLWIPFVSLLTRTERLKQISRSAEGFLYLLSLTGITGASIKNPEAVRKKAQEIRQYTRIPIALGFGLKSVEDAQAYMDSVDAFIVGSKIIELITNAPSFKEIEVFYKAFCTAIHVNPGGEVGGLL
jgi:tryptophan synthase alpha chain